MQQGVSFSNNYRHNAAVGLCTGGLITAFMLFIFSMPGIGFGIWMQSETAATALHIAALLCLCGLALIPKATSYLLQHPLIYIPLLIGLLSLVLAPLHPLPVRSILGSVRTGEGAVWWLDIGIMSAAALFLWQFPLWRKTLLGFALIGLVIPYGLSVANAYDRHITAPYYFTDYLALNVLAFMPLMYVAITGRLQGWKGSIVFYIILNILILVTENKAMIGFALVMPPLFYALWQLLKSSPRLENRLSLTILALIPVGAIILLIGSTFAADGFYAYQNSGIFKTVASRGYLILAPLAALMHDGWAWLTGLGWGSFVDHIARYLPTQWLDVTEYRRFQWDGLKHDHFHSHNMFVETLSAIGIAGLALFFAYIMSFALFARRSLQKPAILFAAGLMVWASFWFMLPLNMAALILACAILARRAYALPACITRPLKTKPLLYILLLVIGTAQITAAYAISSTARQTFFIDPQEITIETAQENCPNTYNDYGAGGMHLAKMMLDRVRYAIDLTDRDEEADPQQVRNHIKAINNMFCQSQRYIETQRTGMRLVVARLMTRGEIELGLEDYLNNETQEFYYNGWQEDLMDWLKSNPDRTDLAVPYLLYHIIHEHEDRSEPVINLIRSQTPYDPVGQWFKGLLLLQDHRTADSGIKLMKQALKGGVQRRVPVEPDLIEQLERH